jgi:hypothetical protein
VGRNQVSYWTYPNTSLIEAWWSLRCCWRLSWLRRTLFYFSASERSFRWHMARARALDCDVYCLFHAGDAAKCANDPIHG